MTSKIEANCLESSSFETRPKIKQNQELGATGCYKLPTLAVLKRSLHKSMCPELTTRRGIAVLRPYEFKN